MSGTISGIRSMRYSTVQRMSDPDQVLAEVETYWHEAGLSDAEVEEMRAELAQHLGEAAQHGRTVEDVIGDRAKFAESWARERTGKQVVAWTDVKSGRVRTRRAAQRELILYGIGAIALIGAAAAVAGIGGGDVENEIWRWLWTIFAVVMGIGEMFTAGFFLLPFAIGGAASAILAWIGAGLLSQWLVFFGVTVFSLAYLRRYIGHQDDVEQPRVGANRWVGSEGVVLEAIDPHAGSGMVRVLNEEWRATSLSPIKAGARIVVTDVQGARLVVEQLES
jgi:membrane protein implicated in regulation of membrane protease activity